ncbi:manganese efflux pump [Nakamurella flavida]|uniref:Putative manganese efflux pump MntP n=1 Tax=Nakamurella flavida TaxID=363630 RepID=A0A938YPT3_9ACTN|nr:manganese efflux pump [Nakamurella flavida]MDP9778807.1 putative Mn2+ efflux pump MntP [Nakamurella flavida]
MSFFSLVLIALGVSADAFAVALGKGLHMRRFDYRSAALVAVTFGVFQGVMPLIGWLLASSFASQIVAVDHWIAFGLLALIGGKMLYEALFGGEDVEPDSDGISVRALLVLALATSIDALAVGISFAFLEVSILGAAGLIALFTLVISFVGVVLGHRMGARLGRPAEVAGGLVLIVIGISILVEHLGGGGTALG